MKGLFRGSRCVPRTRSSLSRQSRSYHAAAFRGKWCSGKNVCRPAAVSYTHLDVYKRQSISFAQSAGQQVAMDVTRGLLQGTSGYLAKKFRTVKVKLKAGYKVMLYAKQQ